MQDLRSYHAVIMAAGLPAEDVRRERRIERAAGIVANSANVVSRRRALNELVREAASRSPAAVAAIVRARETA